VAPSFFRFLQSSSATDLHMHVNEMVDDMVALTD